MLKGANLIRAARKAVCLMTKQEIAALEAEVAKRPSRRVVTSHRSRNHEASQSCPECTAEIVEGFVVENLL